MTPDTTSAAISPYLDEAITLGLNFRPITGLTVKRATRLGIDLDELGKAADSSLPDDVYHDHVMLVSWLLCAPEDEIAAATYNENEQTVAEAWQAAHVTTISREAAAMRAFMCRWLEYRVELDRVFGSDETPAK